MIRSSSVRASHPRRKTGSWRSQERSWENISNALSILDRVCSAGKSVSPDAFSRYTNVANWNSSIIRVALVSEALLGRISIFLICQWSNSM